MKKRTFETEDDFDNFLKKEKQEKRKVAADTWMIIGLVFLFFGIITSLVFWEIWLMISGISSFGFSMVMWYLAEIRRLLLNLNEK